MGDLKALLSRAERVAKSRERQAAFRASYLTMSTGVSGLRDGETDDAAEVADVLTALLRALIAQREGASA